MAQILATPRTTNGIIISTHPLKHNLFHFLPPYNYYRSFYHTRTENKSIILSSNINFSLTNSLPHVGTSVDE